ncbi:hypothetical protein P9869_43680 [Streptomyces ossamyceticus]|nr:hypothetical protein [Streptomyces ossamyceticus]
MIGVVSGIPAMSSAWYVGPVARHFSNADLSWIPGMVVTSVVYLTLVRVGRGARGESFTALAGRQRQSPCDQNSQLWCQSLTCVSARRSRAWMAHRASPTTFGSRLNPPQACSGNKGLEQCGNAVDDPSFWTTRHCGRTPTE